MKARRFQYKYRENASALHIAVGECLRKSKIFGGYPIYQEYPVNKVNEGYYNSSHHFDWVIPRLKVIFECHGEQHYIPTNFSGKVTEETILEFQDLKFRDEKKKDAALEANYTYVEVSFKETITENQLVKLYKDAFDPSKGQESSISSSELYRERMRKYRHEAYRRMKEKKQCPQT